MSDRLEAKVREALAGRADFGMTQTDTQKELRRFQSRLAGSRRARRARIAIALTATAAIAAAVVALAVTLGSRTNSSSTPANPTSQTPASTSTLPTDYPSGSWVRVGRDTQQGSLVLYDFAGARLQDVVGFNNESLTFPKPHEMTFSPPTDNQYCSTSGTYTYAVSRHRLAFTVVNDQCSRRRSFLTKSSWKGAP